MKNILMIVFCTGFLGCASVQPPTGSVNGLQFGMPKQQMLVMLGRPDSIEIYRKPDQTRMEFYIYRRSFDSPDSCPVCLINNKVMGWGKTFYEDHLSPDDIRIK